jgi:hypothetical protein
MGTRLQYREGHEAMRSVVDSVRTAARGSFTAVLVYALMRAGRSLAR